MWKTVRVHGGVQMMDNNEIHKMVDDLVGQARHNYKYNEWLKDWEDLYKKVDNPMLIQTKAEALNVCDMLIQQGIDNKTIPFGSLIHRLGLRLMDYLMRCDP